MPLFSRHSLLHQTAYSDLKRRALEQQRWLVGTPGSVGARDVKGRRFHYRQFYDAGGRKTATYIGPEGTLAGDARAALVREDIATANGLLREARELGRVGYVRLDSRSGAVLAALANRALFRSGATLVGSHAYGVLLNELGVKAAPYATQDLDLARGRRLALDPAVPFVDMLAESTVDLLPVPGLGRGAPATSYKTRGVDGFRVDLLTHASGGAVTTALLPELSAHATALPHLAYLIDSPMDGVALAREATVPVRVPRPEAFAWHKMLVSQLRGETREKRSKDALQAAVVFGALAEDAGDVLEQAFAALPRGVRTKTRLGAVAVLELLEGGKHDRAAEALRSFL